MMVQIGHILFGENATVVHFSMERLKNYKKRIILLAVITGVSAFALASENTGKQGESDKDWIRRLQEYSKPHVFKEMKELYKANFDKEEYEKSQSYGHSKSRFGLLNSTFQTIIFVLFFVFPTTFYYFSNHEIITKGVLRI